MSARTARPEPVEMPLRVALAGVTHDLKTWPTYFGPVWDGTKTFELRVDDRGYQAGDRLALSEWDPAADCDCRTRNRTHDHGGVNACPRYTGRLVDAQVGYVLSSTPTRNGRPGWRGDGYVVLALINVELVRIVSPEPFRGGSLPTHPAPAPLASIATVDGAFAGPRQDREALGRVRAESARAAMRRSALALPDHTPEAANCFASVPGHGKTNLTCSPCQLKQKEAAQ